MAQVTPAGGGPLAYAGTFLLATAFYALTVHLAARYVLGDVPLRRALAVGTVPAATTLLLQQYGPAASIAVAVVADALAIHAVYRIRVSLTAAVTVIHYTVSVLLGLTLFNLLRLAATAPG